MKDYSSSVGGNRLCGQILRTHKEKVKYLEMHGVLDGDSVMCNYWVRDNDLIREIYAQYTRSIA